MHPATLSGTRRTINTLNIASANAIDHVRNQALPTTEMGQLCRSLISYATRLCLVSILDVISACAIRPE